MPQSKKPRKKRVAGVSAPKATVSPAQGAAALEALLASIRGGGNDDDQVRAAQDIVY